jgi:hypothetical protein
VFASLNILFFVFHTALILFNVFGWIPKRTRKWNLLTLCITLLSWVGMGFCYGMGYCVCTDLHWQVRRGMGINEDADTFIVLLVRTVSGWDPPVDLVNTVAMWVFITALVMSLALNGRDWLGSRRAASENLAR